MISNDSPFAPIDPTDAPMPFFVPVSVRILLFILLSGLIIAIWPGITQAAPPAQAPDTPPAVAGGQAHWVENCQPCHGPTGKGDGPAAQSIPDPLPDFSDPQTARHLLPVENFEVIKNGRADKLMPPWGNRLSDAQIWDAAAYVWRLSTTPQDLAAGETLYLEQCAACHGENGTGDGPESPAEIVDFTDLPVMVRRSQADLQANFLAGDQHAQFSDLAEAQLWQTLDYIRTFSFEVTLPKSDGKLTGQVINATTNEAVGDIEITLHVFQNDVEIDTRTTQADSEGNYTFENLPAEHTILYMLEGHYQDIVYLSDEPGIFTPNNTETTLDLKVYDTTTGDEAISITQLHYLLSFSPGAVNVVQIFVVGNNGDQTYIGQENGQTFSFSLPSGATAVRFQNDPAGTRFIQTDRGYADTEPVIPGEDGLTVVVLYDMPYDDDTLDIQFPLPADVASLNVLASDQGATLSSDQLQFVETRQVQGATFSIFNGANLAGGETLGLKLTGLDQLEFAMPANAPGATVPGNRVDQNLLRWIILGLGGVAIVVAGVIYPLMRPQLAPQSSLYDEDPDLYRQKLLLTLVRLDEAFQAGELDEEIYRRARIKYKTELAAMMGD